MCRASSVVCRLLDKLNDIFRGGILQRPCRGTSRPRCSSRFASISLLCCFSSCVSGASAEAKSVVEEAGRIAAVHCAALWAGRIAAPAVYRNVATGTLPSVGELRSVAPRKRKQA